MLYRILHFVMFGFFLIATIIQFNAPNAVVWISIYLMAAGITLLALWKKVWWVLPTALSFGSGFAAMNIAKELPKTQSVWDTQTGQGLIGLLIVCAWMAILLFLNRAATVPVKRRTMKAQK